MSRSPASTDTLISRRTVLLGAAAGVGTALSLRSHAALPLAASMAAPGNAVLIENFSADGKSLGVVREARVVKTPAQWRAQLSALSFDVTREAATETPFSGAYDHNYSRGLYHCICCATVLYDSRTKFDSGTGWPSFWQPISRYNVLQTVDTSLGMQRTAISCSRCAAHLGHVFDDGPRPTGLRYCMNSVALNFVAHA